MLQRGAFVTFTMLGRLYRMNSIIYLHMLLLRFNAESLSVCGVTIRLPITGGLIAGRNGILVEPLLWESNYRVSDMPL